MDLTPGVRIAERYELLTKIGEGGAGSVWEARDTRVDVRVALKVAAATGQAYEDFHRRFRREASIGYHLGRDPGFVRCLDWGVLEQGVALYIVMDLVEGATPLDIRSGPRQARLQAMTTVAGLLARVHAKRVVHRDIKPDNVLRAKAGTLHLSDFGSAKRLDVTEEQDAGGTERKTHPGTLLGTPLYMPPEQFQDPAGVDERSDVYALGVMLYEALLGRPPFQGGSPLELMSSQAMVFAGVSPPPPSPRVVDPTVPTEIDALCGRAISLDPAQRPTAEELQRALKEEAKRPPAPARAAPTPAPPPATRPAPGPSRGAPPKGAPPPKGPAKPASGRFQREPSRTSTGRIPLPPPTDPGTTVRLDSSSTADLLEVMGRRAPRSEGGQPTDPRGERLGPVGLDADGFTTLEAIVAARDRLGGNVLRALLSGLEAIRVVDERPIEGVTRYAGLVAFLLPRHGSSGRVTIGRTRAADLTMDLVTISKEHVAIEPAGPGRWTCTDPGSRNGSKLNGAPLAPGDRRPLGPTDVLRLADHVSIARLDLAPYLED